MHVLELTSQTGTKHFSATKQTKVALESSCTLNVILACNINGKTNQLM